MRARGCRVAGIALILSGLTGCGGSPAPSPQPGQTAAPFLIRDLVPGAVSSFPAIATDGSDAFIWTASRELWRTQGTEPTTLRVASLPDGMRTENWSALLRDQLFLSGTLPSSGTELWRIGSGGASLVLDINPLTPSSNGSGGSSYPSLLTVVGPSLFFAACDGKGHFLWVSEGTPESTRRLAGPFDRQDTFGDVCLSPRRIWSPVAFNGALFFLASTPTTGQGLWVSDGTPQGTRQIVQIDPGAYDDTNIFHYIPAPAVAELVVMGGRMYFRGGYHLWTSDGTASGTAAIANTAVFPSELVASTGRLFFFNVDGLWTSDGTSGGTRFLSDIRKARQSYPTPDMFAIGDRLLFCALGPGGYELWLSDAQSGTTSLLMDIRPGSESSWPTNFAPVGSMMYFSANDGLGNRLWASDGTATGTRKVGGPIGPTISGDFGNPWRNLAKVKDGLVFAGNDAEHGTELWGFRTP